MGEDSQASRKHRRAILHVGPPKTGTTVLQRVFLENKDLLLAHGILYPGTNENHYHFQTAFSDTPSRLIQVQRDGIASVALPEFIATFKRDFETELENSGAHTIVVSSEYFMGMSRSEVGSMLAYLGTFVDEIQAIYYLRDPGSHYLSAVLQNIRDGRLSGTVPLVDGDLPSYTRNADAICRLAEIFSGRLIVREYRSPESGGFDIVQDFLQAAGLGAIEGLRSSGRRDNTGMGHATAAIVALVNARIPQFDAEGTYILDPARDWMIEAILQGDPHDPRPRLDDETAARLRALVAPSFDLIRDLVPNAFAAQPQGRAGGPGVSRISVEDVDRTRLCVLLLNALHALSRRAVEYRDWALHEKRQAAEMKRQVEDVLSRH